MTYSYLVSYEAPRYGMKAHASVHLTRPWDSDEATREVLIVVAEKADLSPSDVIIIGVFPYERAS